MAVRRVSPQEAKELMDEEGYAHVDVRSIPEFEAGHPAGAYNVPLNHRGPAGVAPNPDFLAVMQAHFPKDAKVIVSCQAGGRSARAAALLEQAGYTSVADATAGYEGKPDPATGRFVPGWRPSGLPVAIDSPPERTYSSLQPKK
jgi:rhodanese-related sulfurtransferase